MELLGGNGLLKQMTKAVLLERAPAEELADHLVYDIRDPARPWIG